MICDSKTGMRWIQANVDSAKIPEPPDCGIRSVSSTKYQTFSFGLIFLYWIKLCP